MKKWIGKSFLNAQTFLLDFLLSSKILWKIWIDLERLVDHCASLRFQWLFLVSHRQFISFLRSVHLTLLDLLRSGLKLLGSGNIQRWQWELSLVLEEGSELEIIFSIKAGFNSDVISISYLMRSLDEGILTEWVQGIFVRVCWFLQWRRKDRWRRNLRLKGIYHPRPTCIVRISSSKVPESPFGQRGESRGSKVSSWLGGVAFQWRQ